jgi:flagellar biogenesis protein FliO
MLSFASKFSQEIVQDKQEKEIKIIIKDANYHSKVTKTFSNHLISSLTITPFENSIQIDIKSDKEFDISASKTVDGYGLRIRVKTHLKPPTKTAQQPIVQPIKTKTIKNSDTDTGIDYATYYIVMGVLLLIVIVLWILKKRLDTSWLGGKSAGDGLIVHFAKPVDVKTKITLIEYDGMKYLIMMGTTNTLIDKFPSTVQKGDVKTEFDSHLRIAQEKLDTIANATKKMRS